jgi:hypothetical protein
MKGHFLGQGQFSDGASPARGSSLAVRQFVDLVSGWVPVHTPTTPFRVEAVEVEERYCLKCYAVHNFDVVRGDGREVAFCRCCGMEVSNGSER